MRAGRVVGRVLVVVLAVLAVGLPAPAASAQGRVDRDEALGDLWRTVLATPGDLSADPVTGNPFVSGACARSGRVVAPFALGAASITCRLRHDDALLVAAQTFESSTLESAVPDADEATLRAEASAQLVGRPAVRYDGRPVPLRRADSGLVTVGLPQPNLFGSTAGSVDLVAVGWVAVLHPSPGRHTVDITLPDGTVVPTTTVLVDHRR